MINKNLIKKYDFPYLVFLPCFIPISFFLYTVPSKKHKTMQVL
ncbi:hypothetical protein VCSRO100_0117 [Vibrio cholerae]|nr:hypothetical protein VCSRO100_0117 [Vibrio cholerae]